MGAGANLQISGADSSGAALTYTAAGLPVGTSISNPGLITGTLGTAGSYGVTVTATDPSGAHGSTSFTWTVNSGGSNGGGGGDGGCANVPAWNAITSHVSGNQVTYGGDLWTSTCYSTGAQPDSPASWDVWQNNGPC